MVTEHNLKRAEKGGHQAARKRAPQENTKGIDKRQEKGEREKKKKENLDSEIHSM